MLITKRKKPYKTINNISELIDLVINDKIYKIFKNFKLEYEEKIQEKINKTNTITYKNLRPFLNEFMGSNSNRSKHFWICRGFDEEEANDIIKELQIRSNSFVDQSKIINVHNVKHWENKGFTLEESKKIISENQSTFSLKKCIEKYGEKEGLKKFNQRQEKWVNKLFKKF